MHEPTRITQTSGPEVEPVTIEDLTDFLRIPELGSSEYHQLLGVAQSAREWAERWSGRQFITATWTTTWAAFPVYYIRLIRPPIQSVVDITYRDTDGVTQTLDASHYHVVANDTTPYVVRASGESWPSTETHPEAVTVQQKCGYGDAPADVPWAIRLSILQYAATLWEHRESEIVGSVSQLETNPRQTLAQYWVPQ